MDELDRMYRRLVQNIRAGFPELLARPFEASQIYQHIIPYRLNRRELGLDSNEAYELVLMQLLSGVRGLVAGDEDMQRILRAELESPNPDLTAFRAYATSTVSLDREALRALDGQPIVRSPSPSSSDTTPTPSPNEAKAEVAARATEEVAAQPRAEAAGIPPANPPRSRPSVVSASSPRAATSHGASACQYCGGELPEDRDATYCPHCGQNLTIKHCPACSTELESEWQYCIACGRQVE
jgi:double zinc ribbon protein